MSGVRRQLASVELGCEDDVVLARRRARAIAARVGCDPIAQSRLATAVAELAHNAQRHAGGGRLTLAIDDVCLWVEVSDSGPGIAELDALLAGGDRPDGADRPHGEAGPNGDRARGLLRVRRLMDELEIESAPGATTVRASLRLDARADSGAGADSDARSHSGARDLDAADDAAGADRSSAAREELVAQHAELLAALAELHSTQQELVHLNDELADTNRGVVALYAELDDRAEQLRDADNAKSRFLADMSHELRTPLNSIIGLAELLSEGPDPLTSEQRMQVDYISRMAKDQLRLVGELLDIAKIEAGRLDVEWRPISVSELFTGLRIQLRPLVAGSDVAMRFVADPGLPTLIGDEQKLIQVMRNLINNAVKYTRAGEIVIHAADTEGMLELTVSDTGVGIPADQLEAIFDEFVQVAGEHQRNVAGTGLGLALVRKLVQLLGGSVSVRSEVGAGSCFRVLLPWAPPDAEQVIAAVVGDGPADLDAAPPLTLAEDAKPELLVIADDDPIMRERIRRELAPLAVELVELDGGGRVLEFLARRRPTVLVLDLSMRDLSGFEVLSRVRATPGLEQLPVVIHTSRELTLPEREQLASASAIVAKDARVPGQLASAVIDAVAGGGGDVDG